jgi:hypothetical protein
MDAFGVLLSGLGCELDGLADLAARSARYHAVLRGQSVLVVLDNIAGPDELRALLPPPPCLALATSRNEIMDIDSHDSVLRLKVTALPEAESVLLLRRLVGDWVDREPGAARWSRSSRTPSTCTSRPAGSADTPESRGPSAPSAKARPAP